MDTDTQNPDLLRVLGLDMHGFGSKIPFIAIGASASVVWGTANLARYMPFTLTDYYTVQAAWFLTGTCAAKTAYMGIYTVDGRAVWLSSAFTTASDTINIVTTGGLPILLPPGSYYLALSFTSTTTTGVFCVSGSRVGRVRLFGLLQQDTAAPLPATATFAAATSALIPVMGIASITSF
jgi:hypothetical protein